MKKVILFFILIICYNIFSIERPLIKTGYKSYAYFYYDDFLFYPYSISDNFYFYFQQKFNSHFTLKHKIEVLYVNNNRYTSNLNELDIVKLYNSLIFDITINKHNSLLIITKPILDNQKMEFFFKNQNKITYSLKFENFNFKINYSNNYILKQKEKFNHNISFLFYFNFKKVDFIKYKCELSFDFQHYIYENLTISQLKKANLIFEVAIDFNKMDFSTLFENENDEIQNNFDF